MFSGRIYILDVTCSGNGLGSTASSSSYADRYPAYENPRADGIRGLAECVCVPYDQCPPHEVTRKEDGYYIDPRTNGGKNIEAITLDDVVITDGNGTIISRHAKRENGGSDEYTAEESQDEEKKEYIIEETQDGEKKVYRKEEENITGDNLKEDISEDKNSRRKRREVGVNKNNNENDSKKSDVQPVSKYSNIAIHITLQACIFRKDTQNRKCLLKFKRSPMQ
jgi:adenine-specific DNA glycosylase